MSNDDSTETGPGRCLTCGAPRPAAWIPCPQCGRTVTAPARGVNVLSTAPRRIASFVILREIGAGGMGTVFEAFDETMERKVALKVLARHQVSTKADLRFAQEAWIAGKLSHPNLVTVHDRGTWEDLSYYSMELVDGGSLGDVISQMRQWGRDDRLGLEFEGPQYVRWAVEQIITAARALDHAHRHGVVHRDVKPTNLLLDRELGGVKVADFGLAIDREAARMTTDGKAIGTPLYMAPEQILGKQREQDPRTDVYALGVTLFELLTLALPYDGASQPLYLNAVLTTGARRAGSLNRRVGRDLETVIQKALEKSPRDRYATAAAFAVDLENVLGLRPIVAVPPSRVDRTVKWARRKPVHAALIGVLVVTVPVMAVLAFRAVEEQRLSREATLRSLLERVGRLIQRGDSDGVVEATSEILRLDPDAVESRRARSIAAMYAALELKERDPAAAAERERQAIDDAALLATRLPQAAWPYELQAFVLSGLGRDEEAREARERAAEHGATDPSEQNLYFGALNALDAGDPERAVALLSTVIARRPDYAHAWRFRAKAQERLGRREDAIRDLSVASGLNPDDLVTRFNLGALLTQAGRYDEGARFLQQVMDLGAVANQGLSANLLARGRATEGDAALDLFRQAEREARKGLALDATLPWLHVNLGASLMEQHRVRGGADQGSVAEAGREYEQALALSKRRRDPEGMKVYGSALVNLCDLLIQTSRLDRALQVCREVTEQFPTRADAAYNLAAVHALMGRSEEALAGLRRDFDLGDREWSYLAGDPWFSSLHADPRFRAIVARMRDDAASP